MRVIGGRQPVASTRQSAPRAAEPQSARPAQDEATPKDKPIDIPHKTTQQAVPSDEKEVAKPADEPQSASPTAETAEDIRARRTRMDPIKDTRTSSTPYGAKGEISRASTGSPRIALTFDAGAASQPVDKILKTLSKHGLHCTFFLTGKWIEKNPALSSRIVAAGHEIANHTYSHPRLTQESDGEISREIERTEQLALRFTGASTKPLFRFPFGARDKRVLGTVGRLGYRSIYWHVDCWDSVKPGITPDQITKRVLNLVGNGSIVLMHCGSQATADALDGLLTQLEARGYKPVTVGELLGSN